MPFVTLYTNLKREELPADLMPKFAVALANIVDVNPDFVHWILLPDTAMSMVGKMLFVVSITNPRMIPSSSQGPNNADKKYLQVRIEAWQKFDTADLTAKFVPLISDVLVKETGLTKEQMHIVLYPIDLWRIGKDGQILS
jgi:hypothetical protein